MKRLASIKKNAIVIIHFFPTHCQTIHKANTTRSPFPEKFTKRTLFSQAKPRPCLPPDGAKRSFSLPRALPRAGCAYYRALRACIAFRRTAQKGLFLCRAPCAARDIFLLYACRRTAQKSLSPCRAPCGRDIFCSMPAARRRTGRFPARPGRSDPRNTRPDRPLKAPSRRRRSRRAWARIRRCWR